MTKKQLKAQAAQAQETKLDPMMVAMAAECIWNAARVMSDGAFVMFSDIAAYLSSRGITFSAEVTEAALSKLESCDGLCRQDLGNEIGLHHSIFVKPILSMRLKRPHAMLLAAGVLVAEAVSCLKEDEAGLFARDALANRLEKIRRELVDITSIVGAQPHVDFIPMVQQIDACLTLFLKATNGQIYVSDRESDNILARLKAEIRKLEARDEAKQQIAEAAQ